MSRNEPPQRPESTQTIGDVEGFFQLLARAIRQVRAYPPTSEVCLQAVAACRAHLARIDGASAISLSVVANDALASDHGSHDSPPAHQELILWLSRAQVSQVVFQREATERDLMRFCTGLVRATEGDRSTTRMSLVEVLAEDGVTAIDVQVSSRPEVLAIGAPPAARRSLVAHERRRREEAGSTGSRTHHWFPPQKGWARLDPADNVEAVTLTDLAILIDDPRELASMFCRLAEDGDQEQESPDAKLERRLGDVATLFASLDPRLSRVLFEKLAGVIRGMEPIQRLRVLKQAVLPALFDGRPVARVLPAFPDEELAEALCLLLDNDSATASFVFSALDQLDLEHERRAVLSLLIEDLTATRLSASNGLDTGTELELRRRARRLTTIGAEAGKSFVEFAAFDLAIDVAALEDMARIREQIATADPLIEELTALIKLIRIQPNPEVAAPFATAAALRCRQLRDASRWTELIGVIRQLREVESLLQTRRPEIAALLVEALDSLADEAFADAVSGLHAGTDVDQANAVSAVVALGGPAGRALIARLMHPGSVAPAIDALLGAAASHLVPELTAALPDAGPPLATHLIRALAAAGAGCEGDIDAAFDSGSEPVMRECLRALTRIGTPAGAALVAKRAHAHADRVASSAVDALLRFPPDASAGAIGELLADRAFVLRRPGLVVRLLDHAAHLDQSRLETSLHSIWSLRRRFWNRPVVRAAQRAGAILRSA